MNSNRLLLLAPLLSSIATGCIRPVDPGEPEYTLPPGQTSGIPGYAILGRDMGRYSISNSVSCGQVAPYTPKRAKADACAVAALKARKPFWLRYNFQRGHEYFNQGLLGNAKGEVIFFSNVEETPEHQVTAKPPHHCKHPIIVTIDGHQRIACKDKRNLTN